MIPGSANPLLLASAQAATAYNIERSVRLNSADSAYLSRTPSVAGNRRTWTLSFWVKRGTNNLNGTERLGQAGTSNSNVFWFGFTTNGVFQLQDFPGSSAANLVTSASFRDASAWYHWVISVDTTQATTASRIKIYVNNAEQTFSTASYPTQNADLLWNAAHQHDLGCRSFIDSNLVNGYLADVHFIDGQALDPTSFGEFDAKGVWQPKAYTGTYPGNSFHLPFSDNSTAAALGTDTSGNSNNWTVNNISVAAGAGNDSLVDTPTSYGTDTGAGGEVRGNYCTWNPLNIAGGVLSNGNLELTNTAGGRKVGTLGVSSGRWYWEIVCTTAGDRMIGIMPPSNPAVTASNYLGDNPSEYGYYGSSGNKYNNGTATAYGATYAIGDVIGVALDLDAGTLAFYKNGVSQGVAFTGLSGTFTPGASAGSSSGASMTANFGQRPFAYPAPSGFKALCTTNLPEPQTITTSGNYTGNGVADGPFVYLNGVPTAMTVNGTAVTFGTHADKLSNGFKLRTTSTTYNQNAATYNYSVTSTGPTFKTARAQAN